MTDQSTCPTHSATIDVRSPGEFEHAHIPGAINIPLFSNEERHQVGLTYKRISKQAAFDLGLRFVGPKLEHFVKAVKPFDNVEVYCSRGGMRSQSMGWLFNQAGILTTIKKGGYKAFRNEVLKILKKPYLLKVLSGFTGSGKTEILRSKEQFIDLELLANHRGSAFGALGPQPSNEHLENLIAFNLLSLNDKEPIWVEDESRVIGSCKLPDDFFEQMAQAPREEIKCCFEERVERLVITYGSYEISMLESAILRIQKRLGKDRMKEALFLLKQNNLRGCAALLLSYYDKAYEKSQKRYNRFNEHTF